MLRLFVNVYSDPHPARDEELKECLRRNSIHFLINEVVKVEGWATFREFFVRANRVAGENDISVIANSDIFFDESLKHVEALKQDECFALSRWNVMSDGTSTLDPRPDENQDAWIFRGPLRMVEADFKPGVPGCDTHLAWLLQKASYGISNPCLTIRANHLHMSEVRRYKIPGPYLYCPPTAL
jgi:hypothetical protein